MHILPSMGLHPLILKAEINDFLLLRLLYRLYLYFFISSKVICITICKASYSHVSIGSSDESSLPPSWPGSPSQGRITQEAESNLTFSIDGLSVFAVACCLLLICFLLEKRHALQ